MKSGDKMEMEANIFAVCLLIPRDMILKDLEAGIDLSSDDDMRRLCKKYGVSLNALAFRLGLLNLKWK